MNSQAKSGSLLIRIVGSMLTASLLLNAPPSVAATKAKRPNIVFILTDNQSSELIGVYGNKDIATPNIDRLASEGIRFDRAFAANGMCSPTRVTLFTGLMPSQHGVHDWLDDAKLAEWPRNWSAVRELPNLPAILRAHGYSTAQIGKWNIGQPWEPDLDFEYWVTLPYGHTSDFWHNTIVDNGRTYEVTDQHVVDFFTDKAVEYIRSYEKDEPFYLQLSYDGPYSNPPTNMGPARNRFYQQYVGKTFTSFPRNPINKNLLGQLLKLTREGRGDSFAATMLRWIVEMLNDAETMANVASQNTLVDEDIGRVLEAIRAKGIESDTLVVFSTDQGTFFGQHGLWTHTITTVPSNLYETAMSIPLVFRQPGVIKPGQVSSRMIGQYDIPVTILDYVGIKGVLPDSPGKSFNGIMRGADEADWPEEVYFEQTETRGVRTRDFAYWERIPGVGNPELYDMRTDPGQNHNVVDIEEYAQVRKLLEGKLAAFFSTYSNPKYDLWNGGTVKGNVTYPEMFKQLYGPQWEPEVAPP